MKQLLVFSALLLIISCNNKKPPQAQATEQKTATDTSNGPKPGSDRDEHGCIPSAGYTWSDAKNNCIRLFEAGISLRSFNGDEKSVYIVFADDNKKAELFMQEQGFTPLLLMQDAASPAIWKEGEWTLEKKEKLTLKKSGAIAYLEN